MANKIPVLEIFGPTVQGEGMVIGQKTMFIRTAGCDYSCAWCDSAFTWDGSAKDQIMMLEPEEIWKRLQEIGGNRFSFVTISGGNPALIKNLGGFVQLMKDNHIQMGLETQGTKWQDWFLDIDDLTISPKPPSSKMQTDFDKLDSIFQNLNRLNFRHRVSLKVVVFNQEDYEFAKIVHKRYPAAPFFLQVGNDDVHTFNNESLLTRLLGKYEDLIELVVEDAEMNNVKVLPQLHTLIWGNKRGV
ncbi:7-carboxy-7-deazaguanine synthase QueE [Heyndrickxia acidicola]|uniref:7-carboxy-7-deazaguanine synthase n=1 Tax=Heyndrickxia acidicola TaxID=209389 RepID=A0ABU6MLH2_9BACI|nr:7-carboxy-7-deazaguanine synthase QueE [Heyndrickxia acidicola]MED1205531.1 7-carboxy-7-deazaguanine synthase QueE [Heyndrickxia acidicola]